MRCFGAVVGFLFARSGWWPVLFVSVVGFAQLPRLLIIAPLHFSLVKEGAAHVHFHQSSRFPLYQAVLQPPGGGEFESEKGGERPQRSEFSFLLLFSLLV